MLCAEKMAPKESFPHLTGTGGGEPPTMGPNKDRKGGAAQEVEGVCREKIGDLAEEKMLIFLTRNDAVVKCCGQKNIVGLDVANFSPLSPKGSCENKPTLNSSPH